MLSARVRRLLLALTIGALGLAACGEGHSASADVRGGRAAPVGAEASFQAVPGHPFGVAITPNGRYAFVAVSQGRVLVYSLTGPRPARVRSVRVPGRALGCSLTRDGRLLLVADDGQGATVISVSRAEDGAAHVVLGTLSPPPSAGLGPDGAIETAESADGRYVFVSLEYGPGETGPRADGAVAVYDIGSSSAPHFGPGDYVGAITLGQAVVGSALSPDGRYLYVTSELRAGVPVDAASSAEGTLSMISVATAEQDPDRAVLATVPALNQPVRVAVTPDGAVVWVTARGSDRLLGFSAATLLSDPSRALVADPRVGSAPVGVGLFDQGTRAIVTDSDRFATRGAHPGLTVVDLPAALDRRAAVIAELPAGQFPREVGIQPGHAAALVTDFGSDQLETVELTPAAQGSPPPRG